MSSTQKALILPEKFGKFVLDTISIPKPAAGELLVQVKAASLNPVDWKVQKYGIFIEDFPAIVGSDIAGDVVQVGEGVTEFKKGDRVFFQGEFVKERAAYQQYTIGNASTTARIPDNMSYDQVSTLPVALSASWVTLYNQNPHGLGFTAPTTPEARGKYKGIPIVILGGSSSVGQFEIQFAKLSGFSPIITTASLHHAAFLKSLGATHVLDRHLGPAPLRAEIAKITNQPIKTVLDSISVEVTQQAGWDLLAPGGQLGTVLPPTVKAEKEKSAVGVVGALSMPVNKALLETLYHDKITGFLEEGVIKPNRVEVLPGGLAGIVEGLQRLENGEVSRLKLVAHPQETA
ncbi:chaperonin 10-like protein [Crassisporium funariophilum]|nr:chaperonin 10-like protein [Crassisporium funariophilum]